MYAEVERLSESEMDDTKCEYTIKHDDSLSISVCLFECVSACVCACVCGCGCVCVHCGVLICCLKMFLLG